MSSTGDVLIRQLVNTAVVPGVIGGVFALFATRMSRHRHADTLWVCLSLGLGFLVAAQFAMGGVQFPPKTVVQWLAWVPLTAALWGVVARRITGVLWRDLVTWLLLLLLCAWVLRPIHRHLGATGYWMAMAGLAGLQWVAFKTAQVCWSETSNESPGLACAVLCGVGGAMVVTLDGSVLIGQYYGIFTTLMLVLWLARGMKIPVMGHSLWLGVGSTLVLMAAVAVWFGQVRSSAMIVSSVAWCVPWLLRLRQLKHRGRWGKLALVSSIAILIQALAVYLVTGAVEESDSYY